MGVDATLRPSSRVQTRLGLESARFSDVRTGPREVFDVKIWRASTTWQLTERFLLRNITEHNTFSKELDFNLLLTYRVNAGTAFYFGYDDHYRQADHFDDDATSLPRRCYFTTDLRRTNRAIVTKLQYLFRY